MPEIGEVARVVHYIRKNLVGRTIRHCEAFTDDIVYGKVGTSADAFQKAVQGRKVTGADQQGKYFYMTFDRPPHAVMHFGMTGWMSFDNEDSRYYKQAKDEGEKGKGEEWPPKYMKFLLKCDAETVGGEKKEAVEAAFVDARRLARIRLVDCPEKEIRDHTPLKENGPDPVRDKDIVTVDWLSQLLGRKRVPVKALLLDQANLSGVGNWVADEVLYQARIHPEQYSNTFDSEQIKRLYDALVGVCTLAVETLADSKQFPETWLMKYRWDKGKKDANVLPNGEKIVHLKVGGRTSAIVPSVQKKTAAVAGDVDADSDEDESEKKPTKGRKRKAKAEDEDGDGEVEEKPAARRGRGGKKAKVEPVAEKDVDSGEEVEVEPIVKKGRGGKKAKAEPVAEKEAEEAKPKEKPAVKKGGRKGKQETAVNGRKPEAKDNEGQTNGGAEAEHQSEPDEEDEAKPAPAAKAARGKKGTPKKSEKPSVPGERKSTRTRAK